MTKPICFMVMPFGKKKTVSPDKRFPKEIDFDALWEKAYVPALKDRCEPIRADQDLGALIIKEMIERLVLADLVVADVTIPNTEWVRPTLLGAAFDNGDPTEAKRLLGEIRLEGPAASRWKSDTMIETARISIGLHRNRRTRTELEEILWELGRT